MEKKHWVTLRMKQKIPKALVMADIFLFSRDSIKAPSSGGKTKREPYSTLTVIFVSGIREKTEELRVRE
jgi:hypothetical protein